MEFSFVNWLWIKRSISNCWSWVRLHWGGAILPSPVQKLNFILSIKKSWPICFIYSILSFFQFSSLDFHWDVFFLISRFSLKIEQHLFLNVGEVIERFHAISGPTDFSFFIFFVVLCIFQNILFLVDSNACISWHFESAGVRLTFLLGWDWIKC